MAIVVHSCPNCQTSKITFDVVGFCKYPLEQYVWLKCRECKNICAARLINTTGQRDLNSHLWIELGEKNLSDGGWSVYETWPEGQRILLPAHLPSAVLRAFEAAEKTFPMIK